MPNSACHDGSHQDILARSAFKFAQERTYEFARTWTIEQAIGYLYSTAVALRRLLGDRRGASEQDVSDTLLAIDPSGRYTEPVSMHALTATR